MIYFRTIRSLCNSCANLIDFMIYALPESAHKMVERAERNKIELFLLSSKIIFSLLQNESEGLKFIYSHVARYSVPRSMLSIKTSAAIAIKLYFKI